MNFLLSLLFSAIGSGYVVYGRKQYEPWFLIAGVALAVYPYFVSSIVLMLIIGAVLAVAPVGRHLGWY